MTIRKKAATAAALTGVSLLVVGATAAATSTAGANPGTFIGEGTTVNPYVIPVDSATAQITSLLTVDDLPADNGYAMAGIPDGLGLYTEGGNTILVSNHELQATQGATRAHGAIGAFVSKWTLDPSSLNVSAGADAITTVNYNGTTPAAFGRFCSGDLATAANLYNATSGNGFNGNLFMNGEETNLEGRALATDPTTGEAWVLTALGYTAWENVLIAKTGTDTTVAMGMNDSTPTAGRGSSNILYVGTKTNSGSAVAKAGLTNGLTYGIVLPDGIDTDAEFRLLANGGVGQTKPFSVVQLTGATGAALQADATTKGVYAPDRTEDGVWDPAHPNDFYFLTTGSTTSAAGRGGLWRMRFTDVGNPLLGGELTLLVSHPATHAAGDTSANQPGFYMPDNMTMDASGHILIQEDPGADNYVARVFAYDVASNQLKPVATFDPAKFAPGAGLITNDEESSGIIPAGGAFGADTFLLTAQVHTAAGLSNPTRDVERGQYLLLHVDFAALFPNPGNPVPEAPFAVLMPLGAVLLLGGGSVVLRRRTRTA